MKTIAAILAAALTASSPALAYCPGPGCPIGGYSGVQAPQLQVPTQQYYVPRPASPGFLYPVPNNPYNTQTQHLLGGYMRQIRPGYQ